MPDWATIFATTVPPLELVLWGTVVFLALVLTLRLVGRREAGGLGLTDLLVVVLVVEAAGVGVRGEASSISDSGVLVVTVVLWSVALDAASYRWPRLAVLIKARPRPVIRDGRLDRKVMRREFMTRDEVLSQLRIHGIADPSAVKLAYIEPNGMVSVIPYDHEATR